MSNLIMLRCFIGFYTVWVLPIVAGCTITYIYSCVHTGYLFESCLFDNQTSSVFLINLTRFNKKTWIVVWFYIYLLRNHFLFVIDIFIKLTCSTTQFIQICSSEIWTVILILIRVVREMHEDVDLNFKSNFKTTKLCDIVWRINKIKSCYDTFNYFWKTALKYIYYNITVDLVTEWVLQF